jgi:hypothetical protein
VKQRHESSRMDADVPQWRHNGTMTQCSCSVHFAYLDFLVSTRGIGTSVDTDKGRRSKTNMKLSPYNCTQDFQHAENRVLKM